ncbi:MAG TPA: hypothetical protein VMM76_01595 [Pirellulaceae bacterium]|nr:hypothetical protein [Pirellulaceae bacterium]
MPLIFVGVVLAVIMLGFAVVVGFVWIGLWFVALFVIPFVILGWTALELWTYWYILRNGRFVLLSTNLRKPSRKGHDVVN